MKHRMRKILLLLIVAASFVGGGSSCHKTPSPGDSKPGLEKVTLALNWLPEAEHGRFYAALVKGYYEQEGLDVTILPGGPNSPVLQLVARQNATFGVTNADNILMGAAQQMPIVALMAPIQQSPRCLIAHESSGIKTFDDIKDVSLAMTAGAAFGTFLQKKLPLEGVRIVPYGGSVAPFLADKKLVQQGYNFSEPYLIRKAKGDPQVMMVSDLGFNPYASVLITSDKVLRTRPAIVRKMVAAAVRGWADYIRSPDQTNERINQLNPKMELDVLEFGAEALKPLVTGGLESDEQIGRMTRERWNQLTDQLVDTGQIAADKKLDVDKVFTTEYLDPLK